MFFSKHRESEYFRKKLEFFVAESTKSFLKSTAITKESERNKKLHLELSEYFEEKKKGNRLKEILNELKSKNSMNELQKTAEEVIELIFSMTENAKELLELRKTVELCKIKNEEIVNVRKLIEREIENWLDFEIEY